MSKTNAKLPPMQAVATGDFIFFGSVRVGEDGGRVINSSLRWSVKRNRMEFSVDYVADRKTNPLRQDWGYDLTDHNVAIAMTLQMLRELQLAFNFVEQLYGEIPDAGMGEPRRSLEPVEAFIPEPAYDDGPDYALAGGDDEGAK